MNELLRRVCGTTQLGQFWRMAIIVSIIHTKFLDGDASGGFLIAIVAILLDCAIQDIKAESQNDAK